MFRQALRRVETCHCRQEASCYACLRNFRNQLFHEELSRGAARDVLSQVLAAPHVVDATDGAAIHLLTGAAIDAGFGDFEAGLEVGPENWPVDVGWRRERVALCLKLQAERDSWLAGVGWTIVTDADSTSVVEALRARTMEEG